MDITCLTLDICLLGKLTRYLEMSNVGQGRKKCPTLDISKNAYNERV